MYFHSCHRCVVSCRNLLLVLPLVLLASCAAKIDTANKFTDRPVLETGLHTAKGDTANEFPEKPMLRLETGVHAAQLRRLDIDRSQSFLVSGSLDKTVRIWEAATGRLLRILRVPLGEGDLGKVYSVAISPDGSMVAAGGWTGSKAAGGHNIYLFDRQSGDLRHVIGGLDNVIFHLKFSPDGTHLAATMGGGIGLRVYEMKGYRQVAVDRDYGVASYWADFDNAGRLVTACFDGFIRLYDNNFRLLHKKQSPGGKEPFSVAFSPDGRQLAVGYNDSTRVDVLTAETLSLAFSADTSGVANGKLGYVAWSADGRQLYAGGEYNVRGRFTIRCWSEAGRGSFSEFRVAQNTVMSLVPLTDGRVAVGAGDPLIAMLGPDGTPLWQQPGQLADFRAQRGERGFRLSSDGGLVQFGFGYGGKQPAQFSLKTWELALDPASDGQLALARIKDPGLVMTDWQDDCHPKLNGKPLVLDRNELSRSLAIAPDGQGFVLGTEWYLRLISAGGQELWRLPAPAAAWAVNISGDGRLVVAGFGDGTLRWYRMTDGRELLALFSHPDGRRWVAWTPEGFYQASADGEDLIGWHLNHGSDKAPNFYGASRFREQFYRPDVLAKVLETLDGDKALALADQERGRKTVKEDVKDLLPPTIAIISPSPGTKTTATAITFIYKAQSSTGPITEVEARVDGRPAQVKSDVIEHSEADKKLLFGNLTIEVPPENAQVSLIAKNRHGSSEPALFYSHWEGVPDWYKPKLYVLAVGVSDYSQSRLNLQYAHKDATDFVKALKAQEGGLYSKVTTKLLVNKGSEKQATREKIREGLDWLTRETTSRDVAMVFLSGHGTNDAKGNYHFLPGDADPSRLSLTCIDKNDFHKFLGDIPGKTILFFDSCRSGNVQLGVKDVGQAPDVVKFANELAEAEAGVIVFSSSTGKQFSYEKDELQNGVFTSALLDGMAGAADVNVDGKKDWMVSIAELEAYLPERVKELTGGAQKPVSAKPKAVENYKIIKIKNN